MNHLCKITPKLSLFFTFLTLVSCTTTINKVTPSTVSSEGGTEVIISGEYLDKASIDVDGISIVPSSNTKKEIAFIAPKHVPGTVTLTVKNENGSDSFDEFNYVDLPNMKYIVEYHMDEGTQAFLDNPEYYQSQINNLLKQFLVTGRKVKILSSLPYAVFEDLSEEEIKALRNNPFVKAIHENKYRQKYLEQSLELVEQPQAYAWGATGAGYSVAILDTGADHTRADLGSCRSPGKNCKVIVSFDTATEDGEADADPDKHGTNVASIAARMAPQASIIAIDVFEPAGAADSDILDGLEWIIQNREKYNIVAVNMSLGSKLPPNAVCETQTYDNALKLLLHVGIQVVVAAGNDATKNRLSYPACHPLAITVGATTDTITKATVYPSCKDPDLAVDSVACFSNSSNALDVYAPGTNISAGGQKPSGTSQAAPHVTGALAALKSKFPDRTTSELILRIQQTGKSVIDASDASNGISRKRINLASAMNDAPIANDDTATSLQGGGVIIDVLNNDIDENPTTTVISGLIIPEGQGIDAKIIANQVYFFSGPGTVGLKIFRYTMIDEYGVASAAQVSVTIKPTSKPEATILTPEYGFVSRLIRTQSRLFIVYEAGGFQDREVYIQELNEQGEPLYERVHVSREEGEVYPNYLEAVGGERDYNIAWISKAVTDKNAKVRGAYGRDRVMPEEFTASFDYKGSVWNPSVAIVRGRAIYGWEQARNPGELHAQIFSRSGSPSPEGSLQVLEKSVAFTKMSETIQVNDEEYLHLRLTKGGNTIGLRRLNFRGDLQLPKVKEIPDWMGSPPDFSSGLCCDIFKFSSIHNEAGFALAWTHSTYVGNTGVSFQTFDFKGNALAKPITVLDKLNSKGDVNLVEFDDGSFRVFWNEYHGNFGAIVSVGILADGSTSEKRIDYWTENGNALWPYNFDAMKLNANTYMLSWSNNKRQMMTTTRAK